MFYQYIVTYISYFKANAIARLVAYWHIFGSRSFSCLSLLSSTSALDDTYVCTYIYTYAKQFQYHPYINADTDTDRQTDKHTCIHT